MKIVIDFSSLSRPDLEARYGPKYGAKHLHRAADENYVVASGFRQHQGVLKEHLIDGYSKPWIRSRSLMASRLKPGTAIRIVEQVSAKETAETNIGFPARRSNCIKLCQIFSLPKGACLCNCRGTGIKHDAIDEPSRNLSRHFTSRLLPK
jgi:hypothetical protein